MCEMLLQMCGKKMQMINMYRFKKYLKWKYPISLGLHLGLLALGIGLEDEVIVPSATTIASAATISHKEGIIA
jgi:dTDP-4-amino-4,6-dideoxygalactose transaminase